MNAHQRRISTRAARTIREAILSATRETFPTGSHVVNVHTGKVAKVLDAIVSPDARKAGLLVKRRDNHQVLWPLTECERETVAA